MDVKTAIETTGDLREFLASVMKGVKDGVVDPAKASQTVKLAAQINESFYSEVKVSRLMADQKISTPTFGGLKINSSAKSE